MKKLSKVLIGVGIYLASSDVILLLLNFLLFIFYGLFHLRFPGAIYSVMPMIAGGFLPWWVVSYGSIVFLIAGFVGLIITDEKIVEKKYVSPQIIIGTILAVIMTIRPLLRSQITINISHIIRIISFVLIIIGYRKILRTGKEETIRENPISANLENPVSANIEKSYFDGGLLQYIGWSILGSLVTTFTLGICFPWALCMIYGWETNHTVIEGRRLKFTGKATSLFGHWLLWCLLTIITLGIYGLWLRIALKKWITKNTIFEDKIAN
jgi:hypothetical protein